MRENEYLWSKGLTLIVKLVRTTVNNLARICFLETTPANENPQVDTRQRESNPGTRDCKADALPHDQGRHIKLKVSFQISLRTMHADLKRQFSLRK